MKKKTVKATKTTAPKKRKKPSLDAIATKLGWSILKACKKAAKL